jgi:amino acid transporter/nucleotide-binding universal stress UspA family protein
MASGSQGGNSSSDRGHSIIRAAQVIIVSSVMFTFISYWRTAAVVLCDLASTAYYIGGIAEQAIGPAAPWFILAVMLFSYAVRAVYIESCTLFIRGGVYRVVREALGGFFAKFAVSALMFDYILTGPISAVSAGRYIIGLVLETLAQFDPHFRTMDDATKDTIRTWVSITIATAITIYFFRQNLLGIHESSDKALKIMIATSIMAVIMLVWCGLTLYKTGPVNSLLRPPDLNKKVEYKVVNGVDRGTGDEQEVWARNAATSRLVPQLDAQGNPVPKINPVTGAQEDPLGFLDYLLPKNIRDGIRNPSSWLSFLGIVGLFIAFGHSILAMSGEETLAQVYREVESPKLRNFKRAAFIVFVYSLLLTGGISFLAVALIPDEVRMKDYSDNLIGGLAMHVWGPPIARLLLNAFVVVIGSLILAGAVNTAIIGSNGVLNRVAEDGVLPDWFLKPHRRYGTTHRLLYTIVALQLFTIFASRGDMLVLGEAYAFGVVWSFVFQAFSMVVLRFKDRRPREFKVPFNIRVGNLEVPIGLSIILAILLITAVLNVLTKEVATVGGVVFTTFLFIVFSVSERVHKWRLHGMTHQHLEQFNQATAGELTPAGLGLDRHYRKLVSIRSPQNLYMLEKTLAETDPDTTNVIVMTAKVSPPGGPLPDQSDLDRYDQELMTAVVQRAERAGKQVKPLIIPTNNALYAIIRTARDLQAQELVVGASNKYTADEQLEQIAFYWMNLHDGQSAPLTVRILGRDRDVHLDLGGGNRIPKISERRARSVAELRAAGVGVDRVLLTHYGDPASSDLFDAVLTMLDDEVALTVIPIKPRTSDAANGAIVQQNLERCEQLGRHLEVHEIGDAEPGPEIIRLAREGKYDLLIAGGYGDRAADKHPLDLDYLVRNAPCQVFLASPPAIPLEPEEQPKIT